MQVRRTSILSCLLAAALIGPAAATPSTTYWTPCTIDIQPAGVKHFGIDVYSQVGSGSSLPTDIGLTFGADVSTKLAAEYGFDVLTPGSDPLYFNAKIGYREGVMSKHAPAVQLGIYNVGTESGVTDQNIVYLVIGRSLPDGKTRLSAAGYVGNSGVLKSSTAKKKNTGLMVAFDHVLVPGKWVLAGDWATGENAIGGGGVGIYYYFNKDTSLLVGPVWFNDKGINGPTKWTAQIDINF